MYTDKHEWIQIDGKIGIVGISNYAQEALGDVVYAQLPDIGSVIEKEGQNVYLCIFKKKNNRGNLVVVIPIWSKFIFTAECGALESVKAASELFSPVSGKVIEKNGAVEKTPSLVNTSCYEKGWLFKIELTNLDEVKKLMDEQTYESFLKTDPH